MFVLEDTSRFQLEATLPTEALATVKKNGLVRVQLDGFAGRSLTGKVAEIEAGADPASHTVKARLDLPHDVGVQSGMFGRAYFARREKRVLVVPNEALVSRGQLRGIYIVDDLGLIRWRVVTIGKTIGNQTEVLSGLNEGEVAILNPENQELDGKKPDSVLAGGERRP
jgi:multidrug efflux pump subunit AcrA (membrane-fusion protein)